ncbi:hypothetical protein HOK021_35910 [Streptomyces hygroscopicus]|nr:hypothetical protein HOK021_35910 [Streptomyces hygroscopicus]
MQCTRLFKLAKDSAVKARMLITMGDNPERLSSEFTLANSHHRSHPAQTRALHAYLRWRNANARHPDVPAAQRKERDRIRSEKGIRWGCRPLPAAA